MNALDITTEVMDRIRPWLGEGADVERIHYAIERSHDSVISGLTVHPQGPDLPLGSGGPAVGPSPNESPWPRRASIDKFTPAEKAIHDAVQVVEAAGCDARLTDAVILLQKAGESVADFVDGVPVPDPSCMICGFAKKFMVRDVSGKFGVCYECGAGNERMVMFGSWLTQQIAVIAPSYELTAFKRVLSKWKELAGGNQARTKRHSATTSASAAQK